MIFLEADLSQAESREVFMLSGDPELIRLANLRSSEYDGHSSNAAMIFGVSEEALKSDPQFKQKRHMGKITSHGAQRDMRGERLSGSTLKELNILISPDKCNQFLERYHARYPAIRGGYFLEIKKRMMRDRCLVNSWGRVMDFKYDRLEEELYRQAYSFLPQSECADLMNQWGLWPTYTYMKSMFDYPPNVQVHDSLLCSVKAEDAYDLAVFIKGSLERPRLIGGRQLLIPVEFKMGINWAASEKLKEGIEFKELPSCDDFTDVAMTLEKERRGRA